MAFDQENFSGTNNTTFSVVATGAAPLTYLWKKGGVDIPNSNSASYTTPVLTTGDSGVNYTVVVSNSLDSVTSTGATLTVNAALDTRPRFFVGPANANSSGTQGYLDAATKFGSNGGKTGSFNLTTTANNFGWYAALASAGTPTFTSASAPGLPGGWTSMGNVSTTYGTVQLWKQDYVNANPTQETWTVS